MLQRSEPWWPRCKTANNEHIWQPTGKTGFHCTPYPVEYVRCAACAQNGYRIRPVVWKNGQRMSPDIVYTWRDHDLPEGLT